MSVVVHLPDEVAAILEARAAERSITVAQLISDMALRPGHRQALEEFLGCASVPVDQPFDVQRARQEVADELLRDQNDLSADFTRLTAGPSGSSPGIA